MSKLMEEGKAAREAVQDEIEGMTFEPPAAEPVAAPDTSEPTPPTEDTSPAAPESATEPAAPREDAAGRLHGPDGKFIPKEGEEPAAPAPVAPEQPPAPTPDDDPVIDLPWGSVKLSELRDQSRREELRRQAHEASLRQADYTQKTQKLAEDRRQFEDRTNLAFEIAANEDAAVLLRENPQARQILMNDPTNARALLRDPAAMQRFSDYLGLLRERPELQQTLAKAQRADELEASYGELQKEREVLTLQHELRAYSDQFDKAVLVEAGALGVDPKELEQTFLTYAGCENAQDPAQVLEAVYKLRAGGVGGKAIRHQAEILSRAKRAENGEAAASRQRQNEQVTRQLERQASAPPAPPAGAPAAHAPAPAPAPYKRPMDSMQDPVWEKIADGQI